jgi:hypothetical protein
MPPLEQTIVDTGRPRRSRTELVDNALEQILEGESVDKILERLSSDEQNLFYELVDKIRTGDVTGAEHLDELWRVDYIKKPPTIEQFIEDEYWLGGILKPTEENPGIFPEWKRVLTRDFDLDSRVHNCVITGSLGTGKTYIMIGGIFLYRIVLARLLRNPQNFFGLSRGSRIFYAVLSLSREVVRDTAFGDMMNFMANSPFFREECQFDPDKKYGDQRIPLGNDIWINAGSKGWHVIGRNVMGVCMDEGNYRLESNPDESAYRLYDEVRTRIANRFQKIAGFLPAISVLASSARDESSFTEKVINDIENANDITTQLIYRYSVYKIKRHLLKLKERWFKVSYGLKNVDPSILGGWYDEDGKQLEGDPHEEPPNGSRTELVPEDYRESFARNCRTALQSIAGISTGGSHRLFPSLVNLERSIELGEESGLVNPSLTDFLPISREDDKNIWDYLEHTRFLTRRHSRVIPLRHPDELRYAHVDLATESKAGLSICHRIGNQLITDVRDGEPFQEYRLVVEYDFILTIVAGKLRPISFEKIQRFFFWLRDFCGFRFGLITADQWQSTLPLEMLQARDFNTKQLSLDRTKAPYHAWRAGYEDSRIRMYRQHELLREAEKLIEGDKIDHPPLGSKDTSDSAAGAYFNAITDSELVTTVIRPDEPTIYTDSSSIEEEKPPIWIDQNASSRAGKGRSFDA